jgi:hypothetical protein
MIETADDKFVKRVRIVKGFEDNSPEKIISDVDIDQLLCCFLFALSVKLFNITDFLMFVFSKQLK